MGCDGAAKQLGRFWAWRDEARRRRLAILIEATTVAVEACPARSVTWFGTRWRWIAAGPLRIRPLSFRAPQSFGRSAQ